MLELEAQILNCDLKTQFKSKTFEGSVLGRVGRKVSLSDCVSGVARLQYETLTSGKNDSEIRVSIQGTGQKKFSISGSSSEKNEKPKSTRNRFFLNELACNMKH